MKKMKLFLMKAKYRFVPVLVFLVCVALPKLSLAQAGFDVTSETTIVDIVDVPVDGGTIILVIGGVLFGVYRLYKIAQNKVAVG